MKLRTIYFKVKHMSEVTHFWCNFLGQELSKKSDRWCEFELNGIRLGFLLNDFGDSYSGARSTIMFEFPENEFYNYIERAKENGATIVADNLADAALKSITFIDPWGNEFECGIEGTHH